VEERSIHGTLSMKKRDSDKQYKNLHESREMVGVERSGAVQKNSFQSRLHIPSSVLLTFIFFHPIGVVIT
jgi:hypothetical protein